MNKISKVLKYCSIYQKTAEFGPEKDSFQNVIEKANSIIQKVLNDNKKYYSIEYFGGNPFVVSVVDGDPNASIIYLNVSPDVQEVKGVERGSNILQFEMELNDVLSPLGLTAKIK